MRTLAADDRWQHDVVLPLDRLTVDRGAGVVAQARIAAQRVVFDRAVRFGVDPGTDLAVLHALSVATANLVPVVWSMEGRLPWPARGVVHLHPPSAGPEPLVSQWVSLYRPGLCTYRIGPDFVTVRDVRPWGPKIRALIPPEWVPVFLALASGSPTPDEDRTRAMVATLRESGLVFRPNPSGWFLVPYRARRRPMVLAG